MEQTIRYLVVMVAGYGIDLGLAVVAANGLGLPLVIAAMFGYIWAFFATYYLHAVWTFRTTPPIWSLEKLGSYGVAGAVTLGTRTLILAPFMWIETNAIQSTLVLILAAGVSAVINYIVIKLYVFRV